MNPSTSFLSQTWFPEVRRSTPNPNSSSVTERGILSPPRERGAARPPRSPLPLPPPAPTLLGVLDRPRLPDDGHLHLARVVDLLLDALGDVLGHLGGLGVGH